MLLNKTRGNVQLREQCIIIIIFMLILAKQSACDPELSCGSNTLWIIARHFGIETTVERIDELSGYYDLTGTTMLGILSASKQLGLPAIAVKLNKEQLVSQKSLMIAYVDSNHFLIIHGTNMLGKNVVIQDPPKKKETIPMKEFLKRWDGNVIVYSKTLKKEISKKKKLEMNKTYQGPHLYIDESTKFFGSVDEGELITASFKIVNTGSDTLKLNARSSCSCTIALLKGDRIPPGRTGEIKIEFNTSNLQGPQKQIVDVRTNDPQKEWTRLTVAATIRNYIRVIPDRIWLNEIGRSEVVKRELRIIDSGNRSLYIRSVVVPEGTLANIMPAVTDKIFGRYVPIQITFKSGLLQGDIEKTIKVNTSTGKIFTVPVQGRIVGEYLAYPPVSYFGLTKPGVSSTREVRLDPVGNKKTISNVTTSSLLVSARVTKTNADGSKILTVSLKAPQTATSVKDTIKVYVEGIPSPAVSIPVFAQIGN